MKRSIKLVFSTNALFLFFSVTTSLLSAWALGAEGRGDLAVVTMWTFIFSLVGTLGLPFAHRYWAARKPEWQSEIFSNTIVFSLLVSLGLIAAAWLVIPHLTYNKSPEITRLTQLFLLNMPILLLNEMLRGQLEGARLFGWLGIARLSFIATQAISYLLFYFFGRLTLINALLIIIAAQIVCAAIMFFAVLIKLRPRWILSSAVFREEINYGLRSYAGIITEFAVWRLDQMMLAVFAPSAVIGLYMIAVAIAEITATLASSVADALMPEVAASDQPEESVLLLARSLRLTLYAQFLALIPLWTAAPLILRAAYGESFVSATGALRLLLIASIIWSAGLIVISGLNGFGHPGLSTVARLASAVTTVVSLILLLPNYGMMGAAISSILGYGVMLIVALFCLLRNRRVGLWEFARPRRDDISPQKIKLFLKFDVPQPRSSEI